MGPPLILKNPLPCTTLILDLVDVLCFCSIEDLEDLPISPPMLQYILNSRDWHLLESGIIDRKTCFEDLSEKLYDVEERDLTWTLRRLKGTLTYNDKLLETVGALKEAASTSSSGYGHGHGKKLRVVLAANVGREDWEQHLRDEVEGWDLFDAVFLSHWVRARKPAEEFYRYVLRELGLLLGEGAAAATVATSVACVEARPEHCAAAAAWGMHVIPFGTTEGCVADLVELFGDPVARGEAWLRRHAREMWSTSSTGVLLKEQHSQLLLKELLDWSYVTLAGGEQEQWNVFIDEPLLTTPTYPDDLGTTALGLKNVGVGSEKIKHRVLDRFLDHLRGDGLFETYFDDKDRPRVDHVTTANILRLFYFHGRSHELRRTLQAVTDIARTRAYAFGTRYHMHPDWFFYYLSDLCRLSFPCCAPGRELAALRSLLRERLAERFGGGSGAGRRPLGQRRAGRELAPRRRADGNVPRDVETVKRAQQRDGAWSADPWVFRYGSGVLIQNAGLVTAFAVKALRVSGACRSVLNRCSLPPPPAAPSRAAVVPEIVISSPGGSKSRCA
ncbi:hypothetical protein PG997_010454 [Apiospora hydei]|uniref:Uncharacterized protein n=1 Tax=Apiospora hydei TaxID=1337664 RepID=A0ABR1VX00_9PEZI